MGGKLLKERVIGLIGQRLGSPLLVHLDELHQTIDPGPVPARQWTAMDRNDNLSTSPVNLSSPDLDHIANRDWLITTEVEHSFQNQVGRKSRGAVSRRVPCLQHEGHQ